MQFPYFQFPLFGDGLIIAIDAILHVFISHGIAIGMVTMIVLAEYIGYRYNAVEWEDFARTATKPVVIIITSLGAITGVGIWFITSGVVPAGIGAMLRIFFWPWFVEWGVFVLEVVTLLIFYFTWRYWQGPRKKYHLYLGFGYVVLASISAFLITGILGFMLTPGGWTTSKNFWAAFFNPTFLPQLAWRICISYSMGALFIIFYLLFSYHRSVQFRKKALSFYAKALFIPLLLMPVCGWWWFYRVPKELSTHAKPSLMIWTFAKDAELFWTTHIIAGIIVIGTVLVVWRRWIVLSRMMIVPAILVVMFFVAEYERVREFIRGPYLIPGYMYANTILLTEEELFKTEGMLNHSYWFKQTTPNPTPEQKGAFLFAANCGTCHTIGGKNDIVDRFKGRSEAGIYVILGRTEEMVPWMPPFAGTDEERKITAQFIKNLIDEKYRLVEPARYPPVQESEK